MTLPAFLRGNDKSNLPIIIDSLLFSKRLLNSGVPLPWQDTAALVAFLQKQLQLSRFGPLLIDLGDFFNTWLLSDPNLLSEMSSKARNSYAVKTFLEASGPATQFRSVLDALSKSNIGRPLVLKSPSPRACLHMAYRLAHGNALQTCEARDVERAALYLAAFFRTFGNSDVDALILVDEAGCAPGSIEELEYYQAILNVADYYKWDIGIFAPGVDLAYAQGKLDFVIGDICFHCDIPAGQILNWVCWDDDTVLQSSYANFLYAVIPEESDPDLVQERLSHMLLQKC